MGQAKAVNTPGGAYMARAGRAGRADILERVPELGPLPEATIAVFGLGCVGAPSALELARAGVGRLRVLDHDVVDPASTVRWPFGLAAAGRAKVDVIADFVRRNYPYTAVQTFGRRLGGVRLDDLPGGSDAEVLRTITDGASLVYDATAETGIQYLLAEHARSLGVPYVAVDGTPGGWGGRVCRIDPRRTAGCWLCLQSALKYGPITPPPGDPGGSVQPTGCGDPTFTGAGFDLAQVALAGVRAAVATLCGGAAGAYPPLDWDVLIVALRDAGGRPIPPRFEVHQLARHPRCPRCGTDP